MAPDGFFAALRAACRATSAPAVTVRETGLAARRLSAQELHDLLLVADPVAWAAARKVAWEQLARSPQLAGGVLSLWHMNTHPADPVGHISGEPLITPCHC